MGKKHGYRDRFDDPACPFPGPAGRMEGGWPPFLGGKAAEGPQRDLPWKYTFLVLLNSTHFARGKSMAFITSQSR